MSTSGRVGSFYVDRGRLRYSAIHVRKTGNTDQLKAALDALLPAVGLS